MSLDLAALLAVGLLPGHVVEREDAGEDLVEHHTDAHDVRVALARRKGKSGRAASEWSTSGLTVGTKAGRHLSYLTRDGLSFVGLVALRRGTRPVTYSIHPMPTLSP